MYRSIRFVRIDPGHGRQMGEESVRVCVCVCVWTSSSHLYHLLYRSMKTEELHYSKNMHKHAWQSSPSVEPNRNMDPLSYAPCHTDIWFIPSRADTIWHRRDTLTLCDALSHRRLWRITSMDVKKNASHAAGKLVEETYCLSGRDGAVEH